MFKFQCPDCGSKLKSSQPIEGRTIRCPQCGTTTKVSGIDDIATEQSTVVVPAEPSPVPQRIVSPPPLPLSARTRLGAYVDRHRLLVATVVSASAIGLTLAVMAVLLPRFKESQLRDAAAYISEKAEEASKRKAEEDAAELKPASKPEKVHYTEQELPNMVKLFFFVFVNDILKKPTITDIAIRDIEVSRINDKRMINWLWKARATVGWTQRDSPEGEGVPIAFTWTSMLLCTPDGETDECWRSLTPLKTGGRIWKRQGRSCWNPEFRNKTRSKWIKEVRDYDDRYRSNTEDARRQREYILKDRREILSDELGISVEEFDDIVDPNG